MVDEIFNQNLDKAVKHYSSLFMLPSFKDILLFSFLCCMTAGILFLICFSPSLDGMLSGLILGAALFAATMFSNYLISNFILKGSAVYDLRRASALSLFSWILWFPFIAMGSFAALLSAYAWAVKLCLAGFSAALILRFIAINSTANENFLRFFTAAIIQPLLCLSPFIPSSSKVINAGILLLFIVYSIVICYFSSWVFIHFLNKVGQRLVGLPSIKILRAFLFNWIADLNTPFEEILENLGEDRDVEVSVLKFNHNGPKAVVAVPMVHPGPFKNIGSSLLPYALKKAIEEKFNCVACVPLGSLGHELDLASQVQSKKLIDHVVKMMDFKVYEDVATPLIKVNDGLSTACCQVFGDTVFISFSLSPHTTEDFPQSLTLFVREEAEKLGFKSCLVINAHNSINGELNLNETITSLQRVAVECLRKAALVPKKPFSLGAGTVYPEEFSLKDGMGPGGITALVTEVDGKKFAYIVIDGNNMISGLRDKILYAINSIGIDDGEIFTTDTHCVNALTLAKRGYHPVGEVINHEKLTKYVLSAVYKAAENMEPVRAGYSKAVIPKLRIIGRESLERLCLLTDEAFQTAKRIIPPLFAATAFLLTTFLVFI